MTFIPTAEDFSLQYDAGNKFSFFESEDGDIFSFDHRDPEELIEEVRIYDRLCSGELYDISDYPMQKVTHTWAVIFIGEDSNDDWGFRYGDHYINSKDSFPLTVISR